MRSSLKLIVLILVLAITLSSCAKRKTAEDEVRGAVSEAVAAAEAKDIPAFMKHVSKVYADDSGNDYNGIKRILFYHLMRPEGVRVLVRELSIEVKGETAIARARAVLIRAKEIKSISDIVPEDADVLRFEVVFKKEGGIWKAEAAGWEKAGVAGIL